MFIAAFAGSLALRQERDVAPTERKISRYGTNYKHAAPPEQSLGEFIEIHRRGIDHAKT